MNRRGFLKAMAAVAPAAALPGVAGSIGGGEWISGALAAPIGVPVAEACTGALVGANGLGFGAAVWSVYHKLNSTELKREQWRRLWREHRIRVRRKREERMPARVVWLRWKLKWMRMSGGQGEYPAQPRVQRRDRISSARIRAALKRMGFQGMPWECGS